MGTVGKLAKELGYTLPLQILYSTHGFYIGTWNEEGPISRESEEYFYNKQSAQYALKHHTWTQRLCL